MVNRFIVSDTHFGHRNIVKFTNNDGSPLRPWDDIDKHDQDLVNNWNNTVKPNDIVYHLGDVVINRKHLPTLNLLNGKKRLIRGNHDIFKTKDYLPYFEEIYGVKVGTDVFKDWDFIMSHIPLHDSQLQRWKANIHGHLHGNTLDDPRYVNVCVEHTNFTPISVDDVLDFIRNNL